VLGGTVSLESRAGKGSTFTIVLPRDLPAAVQTPAQPAAPSPGEPDAARTILIVDDDEGVRRSLAFDLAPYGLRVLEAADGREGLELARREKPDAILLDVLMPKLDGWQTLRALKDLPETRTIPVVILSAVDDRPFGISLGAFDYLVKPVDRKDLFATLARAGVLATAGYILVVDDDPDVRTLLEQELVAAGYQVRSAKGGAEALELMQREPPSAVLLDLMMSPPDGFEVLFHIRGYPALQKVKIIIITAKDLAAEDLKLFNGSVQKVIRKGSEPSKLVHEVLRTISAERAGVGVL
jgi:CheY-like chemotaxis protein